MKKGDIVLVKFPFTDLSNIKLRPALVLSPLGNEGDVVLVFISSQIHKKESIDISLKQDDKDFSKTGLKKESIIKTRKLMTLNQKIILGKIGTLPQEKIEELEGKLREYLQL